MELNSKISDLFKVEDAPKKFYETNSTAELKNIQHKLSLHLKNKQGKYKSVIQNDKSYDEEKFDQIINTEIQKKITHKTWKSLPMYLKWKCIQDYFTDNDIKDNVIIEDIKFKLFNNKLIVEYINQKISKIS